MNKFKEEFDETLARYIKAGDLPAAMYLVAELRSAAERKRNRYIRKYRNRLNDAKHKLTLLIDILEDNEGSYGLYSLSDKQTIRSIKHYLKHDGKRI